VRRKRPKVADVEPLLESLDLGLPPLIAQKKEKSTVGLLGSTARGLGPIPGRTDV
jgi:hypothetical protein